MRFAIVLLLLAQGYPTAPPQVTVELKSRDATNFTWVQWDTTMSHRLFRCTGDYNKDCVLAGGATLDDVVQYFYVKDEKRQADYNALVLKFNQHLKGDIVMLRGFQKDLQNIPPEN